MRLALRVDFDDGDYLYSGFNGTEEEALRHYFDGVFVYARDVGGPQGMKWVETPRDVVEVGFIVDGHISHACNRQLYELSTAGSC